jgi:hypothetical protein
MPKTIFNTVATELVEHAEAALEYFSNLGYTSKVEPYEISFPTRPTFSFKRTHTQLVIIVCGKIDMGQLTQWVSLAKSMSTDFRIGVLLPSEMVQKQLGKHGIQLQKLGVGIYSSDAGGVAPIKESVDQNINVTLPALSNFSKPVRKILGPSYEHFEGGRWRECFDEACKAFEQEARPYLKKAISSGRLSIYKSPGVIKNPTPAQIDKMTLGSLGFTFGNSHPQNSVDSQIYRALTQINKDRVDSAHKNKLPATERKLRKNVGVHLHSIVQAVNQLKK